jgi:hypothetical protein
MREEREREGVKEREEVRKERRERKEHRRERVAKERRKSTREERRTMHQRLYKAYQKQPTSFIIYSSFTFLKYEYIHKILFIVFYFFTQKRFNNVFLQMKLSILNVAIFFFK